MTDKTFNLIFSEALAADDKDAFVSDWACSSVFPEDSDLAENAAQVEAIWDAAHITVREIRKHTGLTQAQFACRFCVPKRTVENWETGVNQCPAYLRLLLAVVSGAVSLDHFEGDEKMKNVYYFPDDEYLDRWFGSADPVCMSKAEVMRLVEEWDQPDAPIDYFAQLHEASAEEIEKFGVC